MAQVLTYPLFDSAAAEPKLREESLAEVPVGRDAVVVAVEDSHPAGNRLADLGFLPGTRVTFVRRAPMGDPAVYELRSTQLCLRRSEARAIRVRVVD